MMRNGVFDVQYHVVSKLGLTNTFWRSQNGKIIFLCQAFLGKTLKNKGDGGHPLVIK